MRRCGRARNYRERRAKVRNLAGPPSLDLPRLCLAVIVGGRQGVTLVTHARHALRPRIPTPFIFASPYPALHDSCFSSLPFLESAGQPPRPPLPPTPDAWKAYRKRTKSKDRQPSGESAYIKDCVGCMSRSGDAFDGPSLFRIKARFRLICNFLDIPQIP